MKHLFGVLSLHDCAVLCGFVLIAAGGKVLVLNWRVLANNIKVKHHVILGIYVKESHINVNESLGLWLK